jgi:hypothetical protein
VIGVATRLGPGRLTTIAEHDYLGDLKEHFVRVVISRGVWMGVGGVGSVVAKNIPPKAVIGVVGIGTILARRRKSAHHGLIP